MIIVVDTNIIFSALLAANSAIRDILLEDSHTFYAPNFFFSEIFKYKEKILKHTKLGEIELYEFLIAILDNIHFIKSDIIAREIRRDAYELCKDIDENDTPFISLAMELDAYIWTGDKKLRKGLELKGFKKFVDFDFFENPEKTADDSLRFGGKKC